MMVIGTLALTGFPLTAGYFSKDAIIEAAFASHNPMALYAFTLTVAAAALTVVLFLAADLHDLPRRAARPASLRRRAREPAGDADPARLPGGRLDPRRAIRSRSCSPASGVEEFFRDSLKFGPSNHILDDMHHVPYWRRDAADRDDGARLPGRLALLHPQARRCRSSSRASTSRSTASCSTSGTSTSSTTSSSCGRRCGSAACCGSTATAGSSTASGRTACRRACSTSPATWCGCRPATSITTPSRC